MAKATQGAWGTVQLVSMPKKTRQGRSANTLLSATSRNKAKKKYRGQGKQMKNPWIHKNGKTVLDKRSKQYKGPKKKGKKSKKK